ncbi:MAG: 3-oxoacyl-ACP reductase FabG [Sandaracinaceae bacterium]
MRLTERVAIVTGGSRGLGPAICAALAREGAHVVVGYRRGESEAARVVAAITEANGSAEACAIDVRDAAAVQRAIDGVATSRGRLDVLVTSAGVHHDGFLATMRDEQWDDVLRTNLDGTMRCARAALRAMMAQRGGSIVAVSSVAGVRASAGQTNYAASKAAVIGLVRALAAEVGRYGIRANAVVPGVFDVGMASRMPLDQRAGALERVPLGRPGRADELAHAVAFLASDDASYITGQTLIVDGGLSA